MADTEQQTPVEEVRGDDVEMEGAGETATADNGLTELEPETPKPLFFAE